MGEFTSGTGTIPGAVSPPQTALSLRTGTESSVFSPQHPAWDLAQSRCSVPDPRTQGRCISPWECAPAQDKPIEIIISSKSIIVQMGKPRPREGSGHAELK